MLYGLTAKRAIVFPTLALLVLAGCQSATPTERTTGLGALSGAAAGAVIGGAAGGGKGAVIGGAIGAAAGAGIGYAIGRYRERQTQTPTEVRQSWASEGVTVPADAQTFTFEKLTVEPTQARAGQAVDVSGAYISLRNEAAPRPKGTLTVSHAGQQIAMKEVKLEQLGRAEFDTSVTLPENAEPGVYTVTMDVEDGTSRYTKEATFSVV